MWFKAFLKQPLRGSLTFRFGRIALLSLTFVAFQFFGCGGGTTDSTGQKTATRSCTTLTGNSWVPAVPGVSDTNHSGSVSLSKTVLSGQGPIFGLGEGFSAANYVTFTVDMNQDLGTSGSLTLMALVTDYPSSLSGGAFPYLVSVDDGTNKYVNLSGNCATNGLYTCVSGVCSVNSSCTVDAGAYLSRSDWELRQGGSSGVNAPSVNIFPTCNWSGGTPGSVSDPACAFVTTVPPATTPFFPGGSGKLKVGGSYIVKYLILADSYARFSGTRPNAGIQLTVLKKTSSVAVGSGAIDMNVILVGNTNIQASRTDKGKQNLNTWAASMAEIFDQSGSGIKIGKINPIEFDCKSGGDDLATLPVGELGTLLAKSGSLVPSANETRALNMFLVSSIENDDPTSNLTILGVDGAIGGPLMNGTAFSGMAMSTFDALDQYNSNCPSNVAICPTNKQDSSFNQLGKTGAHEAAHFLALRHNSESAGTIHDMAPDTPVCTRKATGSSYITVSSCRLDNTNVYTPTGTTCSADCSPYNASAGVFCADKTACGFNYNMWWSSTNFDPVTGLGDGSMYSTNQMNTMYYHPLVQ